MVENIATFVSYRRGKKNIEGFILFPINTSQKSIKLLVPSIILTVVKEIDGKYISKHYEYYGNLSTIQKYLKKSIKPKRITMSGVFEEFKHCFVGIFTELELKIHKVDTLQKIQMNYYDFYCKKRTEFTEHFNDMFSTYNENCSYDSETKLFTFKKIKNT